MTAKRKLKVEQELQGIKYVTSQWNGKNPGEVLRDVHNMAVNALEALKQPDETLQKISFVVLALKQSTSIREQTINGEHEILIRILDEDLYRWAIREVHRLPGKIS